MQTKNERRKKAIAQSEKSLDYLNHTLNLAVAAKSPEIVVWDKTYQHDEGVAVLKRKIQHHTNMISKLNKLINY